jgi:hypothetical protein
MSIGDAFDMNCTEFQIGILQLRGKIALMRAEALDAERKMAEFSALARLHVEAFDELAQYDWTTDEVQELLDDQEKLFELVDDLVFDVMDTLERINGNLERLDDIAGTDYSGEVSRQLNYMLPEE